MARYCLLFLLLVCLCMDVKARERNTALSPIETYWNSNLPSTSMPKIIRDLIYPVKKERFAWNKYTVRWDIAISNDILEIFFQPKDIYPGATMIKSAISFSKSVTGSNFIPRVEADAMPLPSKEIPQILNRYDINLDSEEAKLIAQSLHKCDSPALKGSESFCANSLESMIDNVISELGTRNLQVMSTKFLDNTQAKREKILYEVTSPIKELSKEKLVFCHPQPIPRSVHFCHLHSAALVKGYSISLEGNDGTKVNALAVCHYDTENFNPVIFEKLNWKPDTKSICHFLMEDHLIWAPSQ